jgi:type I restriction enzyme S subunit
MATSQDFATWTCTAALLPKYLMYALLAEGDDIRAFGQGSTHTTIYFPEIRALNICLAPLAEQNEIVRRVEGALAWIERLASEATNARKLIDRLDQAVLAKAFRGELMPQDPNDEPASVLLERIRAERAMPQRSTGARGRPRRTT